MKSRLRVCVLISGGGTNLQALIDDRDSGRLPIDIVQVICNVQGAPGLQRAERAGIDCRIVDHTSYPTRDAFDRALSSAILSCSPDLVILAGFMRILGPDALAGISHKTINLHPSLLPLYPGTGTYRKAIDAGDTEHGASIHFVTEELDGGPVISQVRIPVEPDDDSISLASRLAPQEHRLIAATVELFCHRQVSFQHGLVTLDGAVLDRPLQLSAMDTLD
jgi:phosphoribosylglycinamide formyltransferase-1